MKISELDNKHDALYQVLEKEGSLSIGHIINYIVDESQKRLNAPVKLGVKRLPNYPADWELPKYATDGSACFDLKACLDKRQVDNHEIVLDFSSTVKIHTGLAFDIPEGYVLKIYSRSGHGFNHGVTLINNTGIVDSDFTGEVIIGLKHQGKDDLIIRHGDRIAQAMLVKLDQVELVEVSELKITERGAGGFGSTGVQ